MLASHRKHFMALRARARRIAAQLKQDDMAQCAAALEAFEWLVYGIWALGADAGVFAPGVNQACADIWRELSQDLYSVILPQCDYCALREVAAAAAHTADLLGHVCHWIITQPSNKPC